MIYPKTLEETLRLWRLNLSETAAAPKSTANRVNVSMVAWLEACVAMQDGRLAQ